MSEDMNEAIAREADRLGRSLDEAAKGLEAIVRLLQGDPWAETASDAELLYDGEPVVVAGIYQGITSACEPPSRVHHLCGGCLCECHRSAASGDSKS